MPNKGCIRLSAENDPESERAEDTERGDFVLLNKY
jgi:hypothetical protein